MRKVMLLAFAALAAFGATLATAQQPDSYAEPVVSHISYSFDPVHAVMTATPPASFAIPGKLEPEATAAPTPTTYTGTAYVTFTVKLISNVPKGAVLRCGGNVGLEYETTEQVSSITTVGGAAILEAVETVEATVANGVATCKLSLPYSWVVPASTSKTTFKVDGVIGSIGISEIVVAPVGEVNTVISVRSTAASLIGPATPPSDGGAIILRASTVL